MPAFNYSALTTTGKTESGIIEAETAKHARQLLREKKLTLLELTATEQKIRAISFKKLTLTKLIGSKELALITRQLATLITAGLPIEEVLTATAEQSEKPRTQHLLFAVRAKVLGGHSLASAMREFPQAFSNVYCATIAAGEKSGHLDLVLQRLADYTEQQAQLKQKIQHALIYPAIMILVSFGIVGFLLEYVVPKMVAVYTSTKQTLPLLTELLISFSAIIKSYGIYFLIVLIGAFFLLRHLIKTQKNIRESYHCLLLRLPLIGNAIKIANTARFLRTFAILSASGTPIIEAMSIAAQLITNAPIQLATYQAAERVREGANIHLALKQTGYFPAMSIHLIASGEASGQLAAMLERAALNQENDLSHFIATALALFEPAIIVVMGLIVLFIVLAVLLPIFAMDQLY